MFRNLLEINKQAKINIQNHCDYSESEQNKAIAKEYRETKRLHRIVSRDLDPKDRSLSSKLDRYFIKQILIPYLTSVFTSLKQRFA